MKKFNLREITEIIVEAESAEEVEKAYFNDEYLITPEDFKGIEITEFDEVIEISKEELELWRKLP